MGNLILTTASTDTLVTLTDLKRHLYVDGSDHDDRLTDLLDVATKQVEDDCGQCFVSQTWTQHFGCFSHVLHLVKSPVISATITYLDADEAEQTFSGDFVIENHPRPRLVIMPDESLPTVADRPDAVRVAYVCNSATIPELAKQACRELVKAMDTDCEPGATYDRLVRLARRGSYIV